MSRESERIINKPAKWQIGAKTVQVEALPAAAVTQILEELASRVEFVGSDRFLKAFDVGKPIEEILKEVYDIVKNDLLTSVKDDWQIYQLILIPADVWRSKRGDFSDLKQEDFPVTENDILWEADEALLMEIWAEFWKRNPRFDRQKKMANVGLN